MFEPLSCYYGLAELPDLTHKSVPQLWRMYRRAIKKNMPPLEVYADYLDSDLVFWIAFNIQLRLFESLPYDSSCLLEEAIRALAYSWGNQDEELTDWAKSFPAEIMSFLRSPMMPTKTVEAEQKHLNTWSSVSYWQAGNYVLEIPISGFDCIQEAKEFSDNITGISRRVKGCSIFTITSSQTKECPSDYVVIHSFRQGGQRQCSCLSELVPTNLEVCQLSMANELVDDYRFLHSICRGKIMDDSQQHNQQVDWDSIPKDERTWYASHGEIVYSGDVQFTKEGKPHIYEQAIDFLGAGTEESEDFYISQKIPGDPSKGIPSLEIEQVADRITINELTPNGFAQVYVSHQENPETGWKQCPEIGWSLNDLERIERILDGKVDLSTGIDSSWTTDNASKHICPSTHPPQQVDKVLLPHEAAAFLGLTEEQLMNAVLQGNCPGACIDGQWRFSQRGLSKYLLQQSNHGTGMPWLDEHYGPYWLEDTVESKAKKIIERYQAGERYFPLLEIEGGNFAGLDLTGIDFWESNLKGSSFKGATLKNAVFVGCNLESTSFSGADLTDADFRSASVRGSDFRGANLKRTVFRVRSWRGVNLDGAQISLAKF